MSIKCKLPPCLRFIYIAIKIGRGREASTLSFTEKLIRKSFVSLLRCFRLDLILLPELEEQLGTSYF